MYLIFTTKFYYSTNSKEDTLTKNTINAILVFFLLSLTSSFAQVSPQKGVTIPPHVKEFHKMIQKEYTRGFYAEKFQERKQLREKIAQGLLPESTLATDTVNALTLLGQYTDLSGFYTQQEFQSKLYDGPNPTGTITDFYKEVSYDQLHFSGDAKGWYTLPRAMGDYVGSNNGLGTNGGPRFVWELLQASDPTLNFADYIQYYDGTGKPHIGFIAIVHSGAGAEAGATNIWSHRWNFRNYSNQTFITNDIDPVSGFNVIIDGDYAIMPERNGGMNSSGSLIEIGVFAHEYGHIFGLPDLYDTDYTSEGLGNWCLMAGGAWGGNNSSPQTPSQMSAWCKIKLGWITPINFTSFQDSLSVPNVEENPVVYRMWRNSAVTSQYFLVENRQKIGFDINLPNSGFLIFHVDETQNSNQNENRYLVDLEQADGLRNLNNNQNRGDGGDPFPGNSNNKRFDWNTNPNSKDYALQNTFVSIRNIHKDGNFMVGDFAIGLRPGAFAYVDSDPIDFGEVETGTNSISKSISIFNYGTQDLIITDIPSSFDDFNFVSSLTFPFTVPSLDSLILEFQFSPSSTGNLNVQYPVSSNDSEFNGIKLTGTGYAISPITEKTIYASSGVQNSGNLVTIDPFTGAGTVVGSTLFDEVKSVTINPIDGKLYGIISETTNAKLIKINAVDGNAFHSFTFNIGSMASIAFDTSGVLYGITRTGDLYILDITTGTFNFLVKAKGSYLGITFNPETNELWATSRAPNMPNKDAIFKVNISTGDTIIVGHTGLGKQTNDIVFDENNNLYGVIGSATELNDIISINTSTGVGSVIGSIGMKHILGLAYLDQFVTGIDEQQNNEILPADFVLSQNYPNPFNPATTINFSLPVESEVKLVIYNLLGQEVMTLINEQMTAGNHSVNWNATNSGRKHLTSGIYFYKMTANGTNGQKFQDIKKMILIK